MITVVNVRNALSGTYEYCGRRMSGRDLPQSPLANPYPLLRESDRPLVLAQYATWFEGMTMADDAKFDAEIMRLLDLAKKGDLALGCWCAPKACHCDIIKIFLEEVGW